MSKEYLEALGKNIRYKKEHIGNDTYRLYIKKNEIELLENYLTELEQIKNSKPSKALECLDSLDDMFYLVKRRTTENGNHEEYEFYPCETKEYGTIEQALLKAQEQEKENELLKEIIKSFFDRGCPLHQYINSKGELMIEVDDECSTMILGEYKGVDLDKKLKEVLECQKYLKH